ncbi:MAG: 3-hydroxyacyl-CoA dehydrogenase family protein [Lachnospiraceae bacterium]|nr:3-hydroxyacyl-CoA dehydrogenase family protein [Candidatus Equihabitans merdae]
MKLDGVNKIAIVGTGMIGASFATLFIGNGYDTVMYAINEEQRQVGFNWVNNNYADLIEKGLVTAEQAEICKKHLTITLSYEDLADADFVYECVFENKDVKYEIYANIDKYCTKVRGISSTSSAMDTDLLCQGFEKYKDLFAVAHPWNPPHLVPCVEIVKGSHTSDEALAFICELLESVGRAPVVMTKSVPGFVANRLQHALYREAAYMVEQNIASPQDIDRALMTSFVPRYTNVGIFEHFDYAGLDMIKSIEETLYPDLCVTKEPHDLVLSHYNKGELGPKSDNKQGVLDWTDVDMNVFRQREAEPYLKFFNWSIPEE